MSGEGFQAITRHVHEQKEIYKISHDTYAKGAKLKFELKGDDYLADRIEDPNGPIRRLIQAYIKLCEDNGITFINESKE